MTGPVLWYLNRGTGVVLLVLFSATLVLGILATSRARSVRLPGFVTQTLHRHLALLSVALLAGHVASAVVDDYVDIAWWHAVVPFAGSTYRPALLGLGTVALDLVLAVALTALLRRRLPERLWRGVHLAVYPAWVAAVVHGIAIGTDTTSTWMWLPVAASVTAVVGAVAVRLATLRARPRPT